jgi:hypothetical protein
MVAIYRVANLHFHNLGGFGRPVIPSCISLLKVLPESIALLEDRVFAERKDHIAVFTADAEGGLVAYDEICRSARTRCSGKRGFR